MALASAFGALVVTGSLFESADTRGPARAKSPAERLVAALAPSRSSSAREGTLERYERLVATAERPRAGVPVYRKRAASKPRQRVERRAGQKGPLVFGVLDRREGWLKVMLPVRPNGSTGWIRVRDVRLAVTDWRARIDLDEHRVTVRRRGKVFDRWRIGLGQPETPTPEGRFYVTELIEPREPDTIYGAYVFVLSGFSEKLIRYAGGNGEIGLHGTNDPSGLGEDVSHGCIRMRDSAITRLAERLPLGTPVEIRQ